MEATVKNMKLYCRMSKKETIHTRRFSIIETMFKCLFHSNLYDIQVKSNNAKILAGSIVHLICTQSIKREMFQ